MIERLLENWLNEANERSFQIPFAHSLAYQKHTILHITRHCAMELGKDVIALSPDGVACAYQLKGVSGERLTLGKWREFSSQLYALVNGLLVHPSLPEGVKDRAHRSYLVVNGSIDEEVQREIDDFNRANVQAGLSDRQLRTIVKGQLFEWFKDLQSDFWSTNLQDVKTYLELYLENGRSFLPKSKLAKLFEDALYLDETECKRLSTDAIRRALAGCGVVCAAATSSFTSAGNHLAEFEAWTLLRVHTLGVAERWELQSADIEFTLELCESAMFTSLARLCDEVISRTNLIEGNALEDRFVYEVRVTHILGLMSLYGMWLQNRLRAGAVVPDKAHLNFLLDFCERYSKRTTLWGEYCIPQFLAANFFRMTYVSDATTDFLYADLIANISKRNQPGSNSAYANPYYDAEAILPYIFGTAREPLDDRFSGSSYYLGSLIHLFARTNYKLRMQELFSDCTKISMRGFRPQEAWQFFRYMNKGTGTSLEGFLQPPHSWKVLRHDAVECEGKSLPNVVKRDNPLNYLALLLVMPHRGSADGIRWLATKMDELVADKSWCN